MCNRARNKATVNMVIEEFSHLRIPLRFPEGVPNFRPGDFTITDMTAIIRASPSHAGEAELVQRRWSWPGPSGKPVYNYRSEGREFANGRCLILTDGFYEYTAPADPKAKKKDKWLFTKHGEDLFCIAGIWRPSAVGEAFTMLTTEPGPDVKPYHHRQVAVLDKNDWARWLDHSVSAKDILRILPQGSLKVERAA